MKSIINVYLILGGPASGKTTWCINQCRLHTDDKNVFLHVPVGDLLKREIESGSSVGKFIFDCMTKSIIVSEEITFDLMMKEINQLRAKYSNKQITLLLDGYPRNNANKEYFERHKPQDMKITKVIYICCDKEKMIERIEKRKDQLKRFDDKLIQARLKVFELQTIPLIHEYDQTLIEMVNSF